jgi:hypothetical protein
MIRAVCGECPHDGDGHVVVSGPTVGVILCQSKDCGCEAPVWGTKMPPADFIDAVRKVVQSGPLLL